MKKLLLLAVAIIMNIAGAFAQETEKNDAIYVWVNGESTCYQLEKNPTVTYSDGKAIFTLDGETEPVLSLDLNDSDVVVEFGVWTPSAGINNVEGETTAVRRNGKFISGGKLIIVKNGKQYTADGVLIK